VQGYGRNATFTFPLISIEYIQSGANQPFGYFFKQEFYCIRESEMTLRIASNREVHFAKKLLSLIRRMGCVFNPHEARATSNNYPKE
jgi:hypothetical protein